MSYGLAKRLSRRKEGFGHGEPEGVVAPETADHAAGSSAILPMLALGVPGSATAAVMMGGLMIWGLNPGPMLFIERPDFVWGLIASMYLGNIVAVLIVLATIPLFASILRIPFAIIGPVIVIVCFIGAYTVAGRSFDLWLALAFGIAGYLFKKLEYPIAPLVLAMVLGDKAEDAFRQSMIMSRGSLSIFWSNGLVATLMVIGLALAFGPALGTLIGKLLRRPKASSVTA
jgi:TctA family transporter